MLGLFSILLPSLFAPLAHGDCPREFAQIKPLQITYQAPLLLTAPPRFTSINDVYSYFNRYKQDSIIDKLRSLKLREENEMGEAILVAAKNGKIHELSRILDNGGPDFRKDILALRAEISESINKQAEPFAYDYTAVKVARNASQTEFTTFRHSADDVIQVLDKYPALAKNIAEKSQKLAGLELERQVTHPAFIRKVRIRDIAKFRRLSPKERNMLVAVWNKMNDPQAAAKYVRELAEDAAVEMEKNGGQRAKDALARGELIRNDVLKVLVKRHRAQSNDRFSTIVNRSAQSKPSTSTRKTGSNEDFRAAVKQGPFFDKPLLGDRHGVDTHFLQKDYVADVIWEISGGNPQEFWDLLGSKKGIRYWVLLFDSFQQNTLARPEYFAHQISDLLKITD